MSSGTAAVAAAREGEGEAKKGGKKKLILIAVPVVLLLVVAGLWFSGVLPKMLGMSHADAKQEAAAAAAAGPAPPVFLELPELVANLNGNPRRPSYIKVKPRLELARQEDLVRVQAAMPRMLDMFQTFLRETRPDELRGSAGLERMREELITRANLAAAPAQVIDVLFGEMLVQ